MTFIDWAPPSLALRQSAFDSSTVAARVRPPASLRPSAFIMAPITLSSGDHGLPPTDAQAAAPPSASPSAMLSLGSADPVKQQQQPPPRAASEPAANSLEALSMTLPTRSPKDYEEDKAKLEKMAAAVTVLLEVRRDYCASDCCCFCCC
jgi:hypothetical protein